MFTFRFTLLFRIAIIFLIVGISGCCIWRHCRSSQPTQSNIMVLRGTNNVQYLTNEFILDKKHQEYIANKTYLESLNFHLENSCECELPFELWVNPEMQPVDVGTVVSRGSNSGGPQGGILPNIIIKNSPRPNLKVGSVDTLIFDPAIYKIIPNVCIPNPSPVDVVIVDTGLDPSFSYGPVNQTNWYNLPNACIQNSNQFGIHLPKSNIGYKEPIDSLGHGCSVNSIVKGISNYNLMLNSFNIKTNNVSIFSASDTSCTLINLLCGMMYAISQEPKIINLSLGFMFEILNSSPLLLRIDSTLQHDFGFVIDSARRKNITIVAAMGNDSLQLNNMRKFYPAYLSYQYNNLISVGSVYVDNNTRCAFSNYADHSHMTTSAPGDGIVTYFPEQLQTLNDRTGYAKMSGTSFSAPFVTRILALILAKNPSLTPSALKTILRDNLSVTPTSPNSVRYLKGLNELQVYLCQ